MIGEQNIPHVRQIEQEFIGGELNLAEAVNELEMIGLTKYEAYQYISLFIGERHVMGVA